MQLNSLKPRTAKIRNAPVGRGGTRGKTSGRGGKGQTARAGHKIRPEARDLIKKIPKRRGHGRNRSRTIRRERTHYTPINIALLEKAFAMGAVITPAVLHEAGFVRAVRGRTPKVKILGVGEVTKAFALKNVTISGSARQAIEKAGGSINA